MVDERLPTTRTSSEWPLFTASATLASELSLVSRWAGTSQLGGASSARAGAAVRRPASSVRARAAPELDFMSPLPPYQRCRRCFLFAMHPCRRSVCPRKPPRHGPHDEDSGNTDNEMHAGAAGDLGQQEVPRERQEHP